MSHRKPYRQTWYSLGLTVLLCVAVVILATGTTLARYRAERERDVTIQVRKPEQICLGVLYPAESGDGNVFIESEQLIWKTEAGVTKLDFAVANGSLESDYSTRDQTVRIRMIGTLGIWDGENAPDLTITAPQKEDDEEAAVVKATVSPLVKGTSLHHKYGDGWLYTFQDEAGNELTWDLAGGQLSFISVTVTITGQVPDSESLLQPYVIAEAED